MASRCFDTIRGLLLDITGVLYEGGSTKAIDGSVDAIKRLQKLGVPFQFVTNETQESKSCLVEKLVSFGFPLKSHDVVAPAQAAMKYLKEENLRPYLLVHPDLLPDFGSCNQSSPNCVVIGDAAEYFTFENMNNAFRVLIGQEKPVLISLGKGKYYNDAKQGLVLDVGAYTAALEYACRTEAIVIGKPSLQFYQSALKELNLDADKVAMVGDDLISDVGGAQKCGMKGLLVRTGKYRPQDEIDQSVKPDGIFNNLAAVVDCLSQRNI